MVSQARSQKLISASVAGDANSPAFTCPQNITTLVKSLYVLNMHTAQITAYLQTSSPATGTGVYLARIQIPTGEVGVWEGWAVLHPGDLLYVLSAGGPSHVWASGACLSGPPPFASAELAVPLLVPVEPPLLSTVL